MGLRTYVETLSSRLDVGQINNYLQTDRKVVEKILKKVRPEGIIDGNRFKIGSIDGGEGKSTDYNFQTQQWGDWSKGNSQGGKGVVSFLEAVLKCSTAQAVKYLTDEKFIALKEVKKTVQADEGNPLIFPIPEDQQSWDAVREADCLRKDRGIISHQWEWRDTDGALLGWKYRIDDRRTSKEVFVVTYRAETGWTKKGWDKKTTPAYGLEYLGKGPTVRVLFVEGEKAADKAREIFGDRWKVLSYSGVTGSKNLWIPDDEFWTDCDVVIWPDNDRAGRDACRQVQMLLAGQVNRPKEIRVVRVESFSGVPPKWDLADWEEGCPIDPLVEIERAESIVSFEVIAREWVYVSQQDTFYNLSDRGLVWTPTSFDRTYHRFKDKSGSASQKFMMDDSIGAIVDDLDFVPGAGPIITSPSGKSFLNEWYPTDNYSEAQRIAEDEEITDEEIAFNARFFIQHMDRVCGGEIVEPETNHITKEAVPGTEDRTLVDALTWHFSQLIQRPMDKRGWIPMLVSEENGTGKTYFRRLMAHILGSTRSRTVTVDEFLSDYHDWADGLLFYELGEAKSQESTKVYEELKKRHSYLPFNPQSLTDRLNNSTMLNIKTKAKKIQRDFLNGCITSNDLFPLALANTSGQEGSDRRLLTVNPKHIMTERESEDLFDDELAHRAQWIGAYLLRYTPRFRWNASWAPITAHKRLMMEKDRGRSENRADKFELGRFDEFYQMLRWAQAEKIGVFRRKVFSAAEIRAIAEVQRIKFPYDPAKFDSILAKAKIIPGPTLKIDGNSRMYYTNDIDMVGRPESEWKQAAGAPLNERQKDQF